MFVQHINSADPKATPDIDPRYCERRVDFEIMMEAFKFVRRVAQTPPFADLVEAEDAPGLEVQDDEQIEGKLESLPAGAHPDQLVLEYVKTAIFSAFRECYAFGTARGATN